MSEMSIGIDTGSDDKSVVSIFDGRNASMLYPPEWAGKIVSITVFNGILVVACENGVFRERNGNLYPMRFCPE